MAAGTKRTLPGRPVTASMYFRRQSCRDPPREANFATQAAAVMRLLSLMKRFLLPIVLLLGALRSLTVGAAEPDPAMSILANVAVTYANVSAYQDSGVVLTHHPDKDQPDEIVFQTLFLRPDQLRFDWVRHHPYPPLRHIKTSSSIWPDGRGSHLLANGTAKPREASLRLAVAGATGVSRGSSHHIPRLLSPNIGGFCLVDLGDPKLLGEEVFEGVRCHHIQGKHPGGGTYRLFIGKDDFLIRRILRESQGMTPTEEIRREIRINDKVSPLTSKPPAETANER